VGDPAAPTPDGPPDDPLGPPVDRPPIDLRRLDDAFEGPAGATLPRRLDGPVRPALPGLGPSSGSGRANGAAPARWQPPPGGAYPGDGVGPPANGGAATRPPSGRVPAAGAATGGTTIADAPYAGRPADGPGAGPGQAGSAAAGAPGRTSGRGSRPGRGSARARAAEANAGPPALPVLVLVAVVAILILGVAWLVIKGDSAGTPASEGGGNPVTAPVPTGVTATAVPEGVQVAWKGDASARYVVTVMSSTAPPRELPATPGTSALVPSAGGAGGQCFTVAAAPARDGGDPGPPSEAACIPGATPDQMQQATATTGG
jgi:hypothetical protein